MNKLKKLKRQSQLSKKYQDIKDGLKQSKLNFKKVPKKEEENSDKEDKSESNLEDKEAIIDSSNSKIGSK